MATTLTPHVQVYVSLPPRISKCPVHAEGTEQHEGQAQQLPHVEEHPVLEADLVLLGVFYEDAAREDKEEAQPEEESTAYEFTPSVRY